MKDSYVRVSLVRLCRLLGITRQAYYQHCWQQEATGIEESLVLTEVRAIRKDHRAMGTRKLYELLQPFLLQHQIKWDVMHSLIFWQPIICWCARRKDTM